MPEIGDPHWLVLIYAGGYNDLQAEIAAAVGELCSAPLPVEVELAVLANLAPEWMVSLLRPGQRPPAHLLNPGTRRFVTDPRSRLLMPDTHWHRSGYPLHMPDSLYDFLDWGLMKAPGARVALILAGHAAGILGVMADYSSGRPMLMTIPAMASAIRRAQDTAGRRIDLLLLDTCYLNTIEVLYELAGPGTPCGRLVVLPADDAPMAGMPHRRIIDALRDLPVTADLGDLAAEVAGAINYCWGQPDRGCFALRLAFEPLEQLRTELERLAAAWLDRVRPSRPIAPPINQIRGLLAQALARLAIPGTIRGTARRPAIRCYLPANAERFALVAQAYARLSFARGESWRRMIAECVTPAIVIGGSGTPNPEVVALPRQLLADHLQVMDPLLSENEVSTRLRLLGYDAAAGQPAPPPPAAASRGFRL